MSFRSLVVMSAVCAVAGSACRAETQADKAVGTVGQAAIGDTDLTLRASTTTPPGGTPVNLTADAPVTTATVVVGLSLEGNWNRNMLRIASPPIYPQGWTLDYYAGATRFLAPPSNPTAWASVTRVITTGSFEPAGSLTGSQVWENHATAAPPQIASSFSGGSAGDGWDVFFDPGYTKVYNIHHHSSPPTVMCRDLLTAAPCPGFPIGLTSTSSRATGFIDGPTNKLWQPTVTGDAHVAWDCVDLTTSARCTTSPVVSTVAVASGSYDEISDPVVIGRKMYTLADTRESGNATMTCFDMSTAAPCTHIATTLGNLNAGSDGTTAIGTRLYFRVAGSLDCYDTVTEARCPGAWPQSVVAPRPVRGIPNADGTITNVCADYQCFQLDGSATSLPEEFLVYANANRSNTTYGSLYSNSNTSGTHVVWGIGNRLACFDMVTRATCGNEGAWPINLFPLYTGKTDPLNTNCIWSNGDDGVIRNWDLVTGRQGCTTPPPGIVFQASAAVPRLSCDPNSRVSRWELFRLTNPSSGDYTSATLTIKDSSGAPIAGFTNVPMPSDSTIDLTSLTTADTGQTPIFEITPVGLTNNTTPTGDFRIVGPPPQLCWTLTPWSDCPVISSVLAKGSETPSGGAVRNYTDQTLAITSGSVSAPSCAVVITPVSPSLPPRGRQSFNATGGSGDYTWAISTNASGGSVDGVGFYTAGTTPNVTDIVTVTDTFGSSATATVTVGPGVSIAPPSSVVTVEETLSLTASGGTDEGYEWSVSTNLSGASITSRGLYTAGTIGGGTDVVMAVDALGNTAFATIIVARLDIAPATASLAPRGTATFTATGGSGGNTWSVTTNSSGATVDATGHYRAGSTPSVTDVVTVTDSGGRTSSATVTIGPGVSIAPSPASATPLGTIGFTATGGSSTGYTWSLTNNRSGATIDAANGVYRAGPTGTVADIVQVIDSFGNNASVSVSVGGGIALTPAAPSVTTRGSIAFTAVGGIGGPYTYTLATNASGASLTGNRYVAGSLGGVTDVVRVTDALGNTTTANIQVGAGLSFTTPSQTIVPGGSATLGVTGGSGSGFTWVFVTNSSGGTLEGSAYHAGSLADTIDTIRVTDSLGDTAIATVTVGDGVAIAPSPASTTPLGTVSFVATGGSGTGYVWRIVVNASQGTISAAGIYSAGTTGGVTDTVEVSDSFGNTARTTVVVSASLGFGPANPSAAPLGTIDFVGSGGSAAGYTWRLTDNQSGGTIDPATGVYHAGLTGSVADIVEITDSFGNTFSLSVSVGGGIAPSPAAPTVAPRGAIAFSSVGGNGGPYTYSFTTNASGGSISGSQYVAGGAGGVIDVLHVTDALGNTSTVSIHVGVGLSFGTVVQTVAPRGRATFVVSGGSGSGFTWEFVTNASGGTVVDGRYLAGTNANTNDVIRVTDSLGNVATIEMHVGAGIVISPDVVTVANGASQTFTATGGAGGGYTFSVATNASGGSIGATSGVYTAGIFGGADIVMVIDALGNSATATVTVPGPTKPVDAGVDASAQPRDAEPADAGMADARTADARTADSGAADASTDARTADARTADASTAEAASPGETPGGTPIYPPVGVSIKGGGGCTVGPMSHGNGSNARVFALGTVAALLLLARRKRHSAAPVA